VRIRRSERPPLDRLRDAGNDWLIDGRRSDLVNGAVGRDRYVFKSTETGSRSCQAHPCDQFDSAMTAAHLLASIEVSGGLSIRNRKLSVGQHRKTLALAGFFDGTTGAEPDI
jgi:hypothetical protein